MDDFDEEKVEQSGFQRFRQLISDFPANKEKEGCFTAMVMFVGSEDPRPPTPPPSESTVYTAVDEEERPFRSIAGTHRGIGANRLARLQVRLAKREAAAASGFALVDTAPLRSAFRDLREAHLHDFRAELEVYDKRRLMAQGCIRGIRQEAE